eukprot:g3708.t1
MEQFVMDPLKEAPQKNPNLGPIVNTMFSELTLLGFVGLFMFIVAKFDLMSKMSYQLFRNEETMEELFEDVHMALFLVMILFLFNSFCLLKMGRKTGQQWKVANKRAMDEKEQVLNEYANLMRRGIRVPDDLENAIRFLSLRERFVDETEAQVPLSSKKKITDDSKTDDATSAKIRKKKRSKRRQVPHDFELDQYFEFIMGKKAGEIIEVPVSTWCCLEIILIVAWWIKLPCTAFQFGCVIIVFGYCLTFVCYALDSHLKHVLTELVPQTYFERARQMAFGKFEADEMTALKSDRRDCSIVDGFDRSSLKVPPYLQRDVQEIVKCHGRFRKLVSCRVANKHEHLFIGGASGHDILMQGIRLTSLCSAIYLAIFLVVSLEPIVEACQGHFVLLMVILFVAAMPVFVNFYMLSMLVTDFVVVTSIELMKDNKAVHHVKRTMITKKAMIALRLLNSLKNALPRPLGDANNSGGHGAAKHHHHRSSSSSRSALSSRRTSAKDVWPDPHLRGEKEREMQEMFGIFDTDESGYIDKNEFRNLLQTMRIGKDDADRDSVFDSLDAENNVDGHVSFEEFFDWIASHTSIKEEVLDEERIEEMAAQLFEIIDQPDEETGVKDGEISPLEFYTCIHRLSSRGIDLSLDDVEALFRENDEDGDGNLNLEEFEELLKKYMFE